MDFICNTYNPKHLNNIYVTPHSPKLTRNFSDRMLLLLLAPSYDKSYLKKLHISIMEKFRKFRLSGRLCCETAYGVKASLDFASGEGHGGALQLTADPHRTAASFHCTSS